MNLCPLCHAITHRMDCENREYVRQQVGKRVAKLETAARAAVYSHMRARETQTLTWKDPAIDALAKVLEEA